MTLDRSKKNIVMRCGAHRFRLEDKTSHNQSMVIIERFLAVPGVRDSFASVFTEKARVSELRAAMSALQKEMAALRTVTARRQSPSPAPSRSASTRRSRSRTRCLKPTTNVTKTQAVGTYITEQMLTQRDARLKLETTKEWQKASSEIIALQDQVTSIKDELRQFMEQVHQTLETFRTPKPLPNDPKRKKEALDG